MITVDVEDWFQVENLRSVFPHETWDKCESRVERNTNILLDLFDEKHIQATFFVLGWVAKRFPKLVSEIHRRGHEVASHGYMHVMYHEVSGQNLRENLYHSKVLLEDIISEVVVGHRAASFSITKTLINLLGELGFRYDSSYNDLKFNRRYGKIDFALVNVHDKQYFRAENGIIELPISNLRLGPITVPLGGGGYFRLWPKSFFNRGVSKVLEEKGMYLFYCHPWEFDPKQPRVKDIDYLSFFRHYLNLDKTFNRLDHFLDKFQNNNFVSCSNYLKL